MYAAYNNPPALRGDYVTRYFRRLVFRFLVTLRFVERRRVVLRLAALRFFFLAITVPPPFKGMIHSRKRNFPPQENFQHVVTVLQITRNLNSIFDAHYFSNVTGDEHAAANYQQRRYDVREC